MRETTRSHCLWAETRLERRRFARSQARTAWREALELWSRAAPVELVEFEQEGPEGSLQLIELGELLLTTIDPGPGRMRLRFTASRPPGALVMIRPIWQARISFGGGAALELAPGEIAFLNADRPAELELPRGGRLDIGATAPLPAAAPEFVQLGNKLPAAHYLAYIAGYLLRAAPHPEGTVPMLRRHFRDALEMTLGGLCAPPPVTTLPSPYERFKFLVAANLARADLGADHIAEAMGITTRSLQRLLQAEGQSFRAYLLTLRLEQARELLADPLNRQRISDVAYHCGFADPNYFSRAYRRHWNSAPSDARES